MSATIKELADALGVSKTAVRKYMTDEFRASHTETKDGNLIVIDDEGCKIIAETIKKPPETSETERKRFLETPEISDLRDEIAFLRAQLEAKDRQLDAKDEQLKTKDLQIADLTATIRAQADSLQAAQALHAGTMQQQLLPDAAEPPQVVAVDPDPSEPAPAPKFWNRLKDFFR